MAPIQTIRNTANINSSRRVVDIGNKIDMLEPDAAPLTQLTRKVGKRVAINPKFEWLEEAPLTKTDTAAATYTAGITAVVVSSGARFRKYDVVKDISTGEQMLVTAIDANTLTVSRGWGTTSADTIAADATLLIVGNAQSEFSSDVEILTPTDETKTNYTEIFRTPFGVSGTMDNSEVYGGKDLKHQRKTQLIEHQKAIERSLWFGEAKEDTTGTHPRRATGGVLSFISTLATDVTTTVTEAEFETFLKSGFRYGSKTKWLFADAIMTSAISSWAKDNLQVTPSDKTFGINVMRWLTPFGLVNIVYCPIFSEAYTGNAFLVDPTSPSYRYLANRDTRLITNIQDNDEDGEKDEYKTEAGFEFKNEKKNGRLYGASVIG